MDDIDAPREIKTEWLKKAGFYVLLISFGFIGSSLWRGGSDAINKTASLAGKTAVEVFAPEMATGNVEVIPLKSKTISKAAPLAPLKKAISSPGVMASPPLVQVPAILSAPSSSSGFSTTTATSSSPIVVIPPQASSTEILIPSAPAESAPIATPAIVTKSNLLYYEIQITGGAGMTDHDFIRVYNPNTVVVDVGGWRLKKKSKTGTESSIRVIPEGTSIQPGGTIIWANSKDNFAGTLNAGLSSTASLSGDNSVALFDKEGTLIDAVAWGEGANQYIEGLAYPVNPEGGQILRRKTAGQVLQDTNNNSADFGV